ncbi:MAG: M20/M25/M40 family metallo-hydrolase [Firmicutes bacterium]|nr:M20/M25/M40 family metallo-hydrolase [Bacillota bacterium]
MSDVADIDGERLVAEFFTLVAIASHSREEANVAAYIRGVAEELGCDVVEDDAGLVVEGNSGNLIVRVPGDAELRTVLFMAHMDTVTPGQGIRPQRKGDRITSDGTTVLGADDKAGVAGLLELVRTLQESGERHPPLELVFTVCEEIGLQGAKALDRNRLEASYGFVFDSGGPLGFAVAQAPAQAKWKVAIHGRAAHAGVAPETGTSAIEIAADAIAHMPLGRIDQQTTANIGKIKGGFATNVVCDLVEFEAEARSLDVDALRAQQRAMTSALEAALARRKATADAQWVDSYPPLCVEEDSFLRTIVSDAMQTLGIVARFGPTGGGSDANVIAGKGIPVVNLAVGYEQIHTLDESIRVSDLQAAARLMLAIVREATAFELRRGAEVSRV